MKKIHIIGAGITGCTIARQLADKGYEATLYEKEEVGGLCRDNENYQDYPHIFHANERKVYEFIKQYADIKLYTHFVMSYSRGRYYLFPPDPMTEELFDRLIVGYSIKMWGELPPTATINRLKKTNGSYFNSTYQGIINFRQLFSGLTKGIKVVKRDISEHNRLSGTIILTGAVDEYFGYCFGKLSYVGMRSTHQKSETGLPTGQLNFPDLNDPYIRMTDYDKLGYKGGYIGIEFPDKTIKHYPVINECTQKLYNRYKNHAEKRGIILAGRLGLFQYLDMDTSIIEALKIVEGIK